MKTFSSRCSILFTVIVFLAVNICLGGETSGDLLKDIARSLPIDERVISGGTIIGSNLEDTLSKMGDRYQIIRHISENTLACRRDLSVYIHSEYVVIHWNGAEDNRDGKQFTIQVKLTIMFDTQSKPIGAKFDIMREAIPEMQLVPSKPDLVVPKPKETETGKTGK